PVRGDVFLFQPRDRLLKALGGVAVPGVVGRMVGSDTRHLLLERGKALELRFRHVGQTVGALLKLAVQARQSAEAENEVGQLLLDGSGRCFDWQKSGPRECALAYERLEQLGVGACLDYVRQALAGDTVIVENDAGDGGEQSGKVLIPDLERCDLLGEGVEQPGVIHKR